MQNSQESHEDRRHRQTIKLEWMKFIGSITVFLLGLYLASGWFQHYNALSVLAEHLKSLSPGLKIHYTNMYLADETGEVEFKVYIKNTSDHDIFLPRPCFFFSDYDKRSDKQVVLPNDTVPAECSGLSVPPNPQLSSMENVYGFSSTLSPGTDLCIRFSKPAPKDSDGLLLPNKAGGLIMIAATVDAYVDTLHFAVEQLPDSCGNDDANCTRTKLKNALNYNRYKKYIYLESINTEYGQGMFGLEKTEYDNFCKEPF